MEEAEVEALGRFLLVAKLFVTLTTTSPNLTRALTYAAASRARESPALLHPKKDSSTHRHHNDAVARGPSKCLRRRRRYPVE